MNKKGIFQGRSLGIVNDFSIDEQFYLYEKTRQLKEIIGQNHDPRKFKISDPKIGAYLVFLEDSTRTKESFLNAVRFHDIKPNVFQANYSSFNKMESFADTFNMLCGYSEYSIFIIRSKLEGVCRWLEFSVGEYAQRNHIQKPSFVNAGDGKHEHPTQELLDEFSFYEQKNFRRDHIHLALIGDLFHGRTTHSKADGLKFFREVEVDLIAPPELGMPAFYVDKMQSHKFAVRRFASIEEYLAQKKIAPMWYFTRLQLERMGEDVREKADVLRRAVTFDRDFLEKLPAKCCFYHPLPRHKLHPTIPAFLDKTPLNGWERQSINGYFTRIIELGMLGGVLGEDFKGQSPVPLPEGEDFVEAVPTHPTQKADYKVGIIPITHGLVIDHIGKGNSLEAVWDHINTVRRVLSLNAVGSHGVFQSGIDQKNKGIIAIPGQTEFDRKNLKKLAAIAPGCTLNIIENKRVIHKYRLHMPPRIYNFKEISCKNQGCISIPAHGENVNPLFFRAKENHFTCAYCEASHTFREIWNF